MNCVIKKLFKNLPLTSSSRGGTNKDLLETGGLLITVAAISVFMILLASEIYYLP
jgi:hypothetical protein